MNKGQLEEMLFKGKLSLSRGETEHAAKLFTKSLEIVDTVAEGWLGLGMAQLAQNQLADAALSLSRAEALDPTHPLLQFAYGEYHAKSGELVAAIACFESLLALFPEYADAWYGMGRCFWLSGDSKNALFCLNKLVTINSDYAKAYHLLAEIYLTQGRVDLAARTIDMALVSEPGSLSSLLTKYQIEWNSANFLAAGKTFKKILRLHPASSAARSAYITGVASSFSTSMKDIYHCSREWDYVFGVGVESVNLPDSVEDLSLLKRRIGYVSPDFRIHPVGTTLNIVLSHHDRQKFEIYCYSCGGSQDVLTHSIREKADYWRDLSSLTDKEAAARISADRIDCLIDLAGHSANNRLGIFTHHPARLQLSWLGYPHTTGLGAMDVFITDSDSVLSDEDEYFVESVERLPMLRIPFVKPSVSPEPVDAPYIDNGYISFGSFTTVSRLSSEVLSAWAEILRSVPDSRLLLKGVSFSARSVREHIYRKFTKHGVCRDRIELREESSHYFMLMEYGEVDIALDPFPFSDCLTSYNAVWMGVPVVTLHGLTPVSRQTAAVNRELGLDFLTAHSVDDYVEIAVRMATQKKQLSRLRNELRERLHYSRLANLKLYTESLEAIYCRERYPAFYPHTIDSIDYPAIEKVAESCFEAGNTPRSSQIVNYLCSTGYTGNEIEILKARLNFDNGEHKQAMTSLTQIISKAYNEKALFTLAKFYDKSFMIEEAINCYQLILDKNSSNSKAKYDMAGPLLKSNRVGEALSLLRELAYNKNSSSMITVAGYLFVLNYADSLSADQVFIEHEKLAKRLEPSKKYTKWDNNRNRERKLRIGYLSPDFGMHPVSYFLLEIFKYHSHASFEIYCYSNRSMADDLTCFFRDNCQHWRPVWKTSPEDLAAIIRKDAIDILIDLSGYTKDCRIDVFSRKPAPIQISWLGYPNTTGLSAIDYRITDAVADPPGRSDEIHTEELIRLPDSFLCYSPPPKKYRISASPWLKDGCITFGSFNNLAKITPSVIKLWSEILLQTDNSVLLIKRDVFRDPMVKRYFKESFAENGVTSDRLKLVIHKHDIYSHLSEYKNVDIALDSFPYNGTTTTCEALWMGVPVVTLAGDRHASRVGASILTNIGLSQLIAGTSEEYIDIAVALANDHARREEIRQSLRGKMSSSILMKGADFTRNLEAAYREVWCKWCDQHSGEAQ